MQCWCGPRQLPRKGGVESNSVTPEHHRIKHSFLGIGVVERDKELLLEWIFNKMYEFSPFLGLSYEGL